MSTEVHEYVRCDQCGQAAEVARINVGGVVGGAYVDRYVPGRWTCVTPGCVRSAVPARPTTPDPIEAAISAGIDEWRERFWTTPNPAYKDIVTAIIRAAAPILIAAGREEAAKAIETTVLTGSDDYWRGARDAVRIARGGTP